MLPTSSLLVTLFTLVAGLACLVVSVIMCLVATRQQKLARRELEQRLQILAQRLLMMESRIEDLERHERPGRDELPRPPGLGISATANELHRPRSLMSGGTDQAVKIVPPLIAVPDLGAGEAKPDGQSETALSERHGEAWTLAAAGVPAAEIARQTGQPIGQVELIVALYRKLHSSRGSIDHARSR